MILFKDPEAEKAREALKAGIDAWHKFANRERPTARVRLRCVFCCAEHFRECSRGDGYGTGWSYLFGRSVPVIREIPRWLRDPWPYIAYEHVLVTCPNCGGPCKEAGREPILPEGSDE